MFDFSLLRLKWRLSPLMRHSPSTAYSWLVGVFVGMCNLLALPSICDDQDENVAA